MWEGQAPGKKVERVRRKRDREEDRMRRNHSEKSGKNMRQTGQTHL